MAEVILRTLVVTRLHGWNFRRSEYFVNDCPVPSRMAATPTVLLGRVLGALKMTPVKGFRVEQIGESNRGGAGGSSDWPVALDRPGGIARAGGGPRLPVFGALTE
jgi:hypothetical protein